MQLRKNIDQPPLLKYKHAHFIISVDHLVLTSHFFIFLGTQYFNKKRRKYLIQALYKIKTGDRTLQNIDITGRIISHRLLSC
jgi:hypothetical protein